ncbi:DUF362 domain-containing protein [Pseudodesulfovibrio tunisiensis]|uniref:DUF362 domain-containing protein n=1 Tax=Pseudodesulfovibrio tunisiensis TaxID=463192 RepID=UPI001FB50706|nr:DUF362 domain-containing protein [Pseudodesulfovibrio tunisiensis]
MSETIAIARILEYESTLLDSAVGLVLKEAGIKPDPRSRVLVKPNLISSTNAEHSCTNARITAAACRYLLDCGAYVTVADSPAFGTVNSVARASCLDYELSRIAMNVSPMRRPRSVRLRSGRKIAVSRDALEADLIVSIPRLKVHGQMRVTGAVKNLFGCVVGFRKAFAHRRFPDMEQFRSMIMDLYEILPPKAALMDAVRPMHRDGPTKGEPFDLGLIAASHDPVALDTAMYDLLDLTPEAVPLWAEAVKRDLPGARPDSLVYPLEKPDSFDATGFVIPEVLDPIRFQPMRLAKGRLRSLLKRFTKD